MSTKANSVSKKYFLENYKINKDLGVFDFKTTVNKFHDAHTTYRVFLEDQKLTYSMLYHSGLDDMTEILQYFSNTRDVCVCGNPVKKIGGYKKCSTCGDSQCVSVVISNNAKDRDLSYLRCDAVNEKRVETRRNSGNPWHSEESKIKSSRSNKEYWTKERRAELVIQNRENGVYDKMSSTMKDKILRGEFTPKTENRLTHKRLVSTCGNYKYRSSWEKIFHELHPNLLFETVRVPYTFEGNEHVYIVDFEDKENKILYEVKPLNLKNSEKVNAKEVGARIWCEENSYEYKYITEEDLDL